MKRKERYGTLEAELVSQNKFADDETLEEAVMEYGYVRYSHVRLHSGNGYITSFEKRNSYTNKA